jgi:hypothetical protein
MKLFEEPSLQHPLRRLLDLDLSALDVDPQRWNP